MAESFGVPVVGIGDELPNYAGDTLSGKVEMHDWIDEGQTFQPGEEIFSVILTFPSLENPVWRSSQRSDCIDRGRLHCVHNQLLKHAHSDSERNE